ncbi:MAG: DUF418 domain-containing protein [Gammaproteobacteria bacterium]|nr:DUF418 domain-containing protein [Gammaproteobacteria bacterium]
MTDLAPAAPNERIEAIDTIRGLALLGILIINILAFGLPFRAVFDPTVDGSTTGIDFAAYFAMGFVFEGAMRGLFSMLFGAGIAMLAASGKGAAVHYRRQLLLLGIGLIDAFVLLWTGDILVPYALAGMVLYFARNWRPRGLFIAAGFVFAYLVIVYSAFFGILTVLPEQAEAVQVRLDAGESVSADERAMLDGWRELEVNIEPTPRLLERERLKFQGTYWQSVQANAEEVIGLYAFALPYFIIWDAIACMLLGMALYKVGFLTGQRSQRFYLATAILGFGVGLAVNGFEMAMKIATDYADEWVSGASVPTNDLGRVCMALGFVSAVMIATARGYLAKLRRGLAAVGRMALSNYILQSIFGIVIFHDMGFGLWNDLDRHQLYYVVFGQWAVMIAFSVWWLNRYRFGPLEWVWRTLTYGRWQPMALVGSTGRDKPVPYGSRSNDAGRDKPACEGGTNAGRDKPVPCDGGTNDAGRA